VKEEGRGKNAEGRSVGRAALLRLLLHSAFLFLPSLLFAHIGDQNVFFEGHAGPYPIRVVVRPPGVIPGLAEISVRVETNGVKRVTILPMRWNTGRNGAPDPDEARPVRGETNLYAGELWFMRDGAQSVEVAVIGAAGRGAVIIPVNAVATRVLGVPSGLGKILAVLGLLLVALAASIFGAAVRESVLPAGASPGRGRRWFARGTILVATLGITSLLWFGKKWWDAEAGDYRNNRLYKPVEAKAQLRNENGKQILSLERSEPARRNGPLVPEHGKLMHLFLVREPALDTCAHLHPMRRNWKTFETPLPRLPAGDYRIYADVTYETGLSDTITTTVRLPDPDSATESATRRTDPDDSWLSTTPFTNGPTALKQTTQLSPTLWMDMKLDAPLVENRDTRLLFKVRDVILRPARLEHFMGMAGHLILRRDDGAVFTHLHPGGSFSMTAQQLFVQRVDGKGPVRIAASDKDPLCKLPVFDGSANTMPPHNDIAFPYAFPKTGNYRLWVQVKVAGEILTGVFDVSVAAANAVR